MKNPHANKPSSNPLQTILKAYPANKPLGDIPWNDLDWNNAFLAAVRLAGGEETVTSFICDNSWWSLTVGEFCHRIEARIERLRNPAPDFLMPEEIDFRGAIPDWGIVKVTSHPVKDFILKAHKRAEIYVKGKQENEDEDTFFERWQNAVRECKWAFVEMSKENQKAYRHFA